MSNNMPRQSREKSGTGIYQMIIRTVPLIGRKSKRASFLRRLPSIYTHDSCPLLYSQFGLYPMQLVVPSAVRNAVSAATITFTASSMILCFFIIRCFFSRNEEGGMRKEITPA